MNVLLGLAGGDESVTALRRTIDRVREAGDDLTVVVLEKEGATRTPAEMREQAEKLVGEVGIDAAFHTLEGDPGSALVSFAEQGDFDELVIGGGSESPMGKVRIGPVAEYVVLNARLPVTLVR